jgi:hypothetical protein
VHIGGDTLKLLALAQERARLPGVPIGIEMRRSVMGRGMVAVLTNTSSKYLPLVLTVQNPTMQTGKKFDLQISPGGKLDFGYREGWQFSSGDRATIRSANFEPLQYLTP